MASATLVVSLALIVSLGVFAQWLSWRLRLPAILLLLLLGLLAGPLSGRFTADGNVLLDPNALFGDLLLPVVSLAVAVILFEGALSLRWEEIRACGWSVLALVSVGAFVTWFVVALAARYIMGLDPGLAVMLGAILMVTGPTVIAPLLRQLRPSGMLGSVLRWEGIIIDPLGAMFAVVTLGVLANASDAHLFSHTMLTILRIVAIGACIGVPAGLGLSALLRRYWVPDYLQNPLTLSLVLLAFAVSNMMQDESGLLTVTVIGAVMANQKGLRIRHIIEFKENLQVLLISSLFIVLAARLDVVAILDLGWATLGFLAVVLFVARPLAVLASTWWAENLTWRERGLLMWIAPRGIVAAAVSAIVVLELEHLRIFPPGEAAVLVSLTFVVIIGTVTIHGLTAYPIAVALGITQSNPQGTLIAGADRVGRALGRELQDLGFAVVLVDTNQNNLFSARRDGLATHQGNILSEQVQEELDFAGLGRLLCVTPNDEVNALASLHFLEVFGRSGVLHLPAAPKTGAEDDVLKVDLRGRLLFDTHATHEFMRNQIAQGAVIERVRLEGDMDWARYREEHHEGALPLFCVDEVALTMQVFTDDKTFAPRRNNTIIHLVHLDGRPMGTAASKARAELASETADLLTAGVPRPVLTFGVDPSGQDGDEDTHTVRTPTEAGDGAYSVR